LFFGDKKKFEWSNFSSDTPYRAFSLTCFLHGSLITPFTFFVIILVVIFIFVVMVIMTYTINNYKERFYDFENIRLYSLKNTKKQSKTDRLNISYVGVS